MNLDINRLHNTLMKSIPSFLRYYPITQERIDKIDRLFNSKSL